MAHQTYTLSFLSLLGPLLSALVLNLLLTHSCRGHSQLIGPPRSILAGIGDDVILPCHLKPAMDVYAETIEWTRPDLDQRFVYVWRAGQDLEHVKNPSYKGRTSLFPDELKQGNISLKLSKVQLSDQGTYVCNIPLMYKKSYVRLVVALHTASVPVISLSGIDRNGGGVILNCDSNSWYPEPEVLWLDGEGNLLSAGPTETVRGPDDLYTVSSRVTVEKRHSNSFTCRVQQNHINQTRETHIHVPDGFFEVQSSSTTVILSVSLAVCILVILILGFYVWRLKKTTEKKQKGEVLTKEEEKLMKSQKEKQSREGEVQGKKQELKNKNFESGSKDETIRKERRDKEKAQSEVRILKDQLESKEKELEHEKDKVKYLTEEKKRSEEEQQRLQTNIKQLEQKLQDEKKKSERDQRELNDQWEKKLQEEQKKREKASETLKNEDKTEVERLSDDVETEGKADPETELDNKNREVNIDQQLECASS